MPDIKGALSSEEMAKCNERFEGFERKMGHDLTCEVCGGIVWSIVPHVVIQPIDSAVGLMGSIGRLQVIVYICATCGNMKSFSAALWGMIRPKEPPKQEADSTEEGEE
jgi:hypothetical protein